MTPDDVNNDSREHSLNLLRMGYRSRHTLPSTCPPLSAPHPRPTRPSGGNALFSAWLLSATCRLILPEALLVARCGRHRPAPVSDRRRHWGTPREFVKVKSLPTAVGATRQEHPARRDLQAESRQCPLKLFGSPSADGTGPLRWLTEDGPKARHGNLRKVIVAPKPANTVPV